jgi:hypothetical protein
MATDANEPDLLGGPDPAGPEDELAGPGAAPDGDTPAARPAVSKGGTTRDR